MVPTWLRFPSYMVCYMSGALSVFREAYSLYHGSIPPQTVFWRCVWLAFILSTFAMITEDWWDRRALNREIGNLRAVPAKVTIKPIELRRCDSGDCFLQAKIELETPLEADVDGYSMEFSRNGVIETLPVFDDVPKWGLLINNSFDAADMLPFPRKLRSGDGKEGWIHFKTKKNNYEMESGRLRLTVHTSRGSGNKEIPCTSEYWNPTRSTSVFYRHSN